MAPIAILFGVLLGALGPALYFLSDPEKQSVTALIPSLFGIVLIVLGIVAYNENLRKHAMHAAAGVGLLGFIVPLSRFIVAATKDDFKFGLAAGGTLAMSVLCAIFLGLCIKSFIYVRMARKKKEAEGQAAP